MQEQHEGKVWVWCSDCVRKENPNLICKYCYLKYEEYAEKQEARRK